MAEKTAKAPTTTEKKPAPAEPAKRKGGFFTFIVFIIAAAALAASAYIAQQGLLLRDEVSRLTTELSQLRLLDQQPIIQDLMQEINSQNIAHKNLQDEINQRFKRWQEEQEKSKSLVERKKDDWVLNEAAYLMRMAATRLHLANDISSSIAALTQADLRIAELENSRYLPIRKALADEISELQALRKPDIDGTALKIERLTNNLPTLPDAIVNAKTETLITEPDTNNQTRGFLFSLLEKVGVKKNAGKVPTLAKRDKLLFLDQLIRLELESAKQDLIRFKGEDFVRHLGRARGLIEQHYEKNHQAVIDVIGQIDSIIEYSIFPELPDISRSLNLLQSLLNRYQTPEKINQPAPKAELKTEQTV